MFTVADPETIRVPGRKSRIEVAGPLRYLMSGEMIHGAQYRDDDRCDIPVPYYPSPGPVDDLFETVGDGSGVVGVVGLGTGGLAVHGPPDSSMVFFEYDPRVVEFARGAFSYLERALASASIVVEEGRRALREWSGAAFDLLVFDAFVADAVPSHLLTQEALALYRDRLAAGGALAFHVSNKFVDLPALLGNAARKEGLAAWVRAFDPGEDEQFDDLFVEPTRWVTAARPRTEPAKQFRGSDAWEALTISEKHPVWTDHDAARIEMFR